MRWRQRSGISRFATACRRPAASAPSTLAALNVPVGKRLHQLAASIDRLAAMDITFGQRYVVVNIPSTVAEAVEGDNVVRRYVVVVGKTDRPSPTLTTMITTVNLNPTWTVPLSIAKKDVIPKHAKDPAYLARMHMRALDASGNEIDPRRPSTGIPTVRPISRSARTFGTWNALGAVRVDMPTLLGLHARHQPQEPVQQRLPLRIPPAARGRRAARDLAAWVLRGTPGWGRREIDAATPPARAPTSGRRRRF